MFDLVRKIFSKLYEYDIYCIQERSVLTLIDILTHTGRKFRRNRVENVHIPFIKWLRYREQGKKATLHATL